MEMGLQVCLTSRHSVTQPLKGWPDLVTICKFLPLIDLASYTKSAIIQSFGTKS